MAYGYSLVGTVVGVGGGASVGLVGKLAFAFAPHAAAAFVDAAGLVVVPDDLAGRPSDAAFLPAAETAISIVHDAHPRYGEAVGVFGCGIIGLLVAAALVRLGVIVTAVDLDPSRRALARSLGVRVATGPEGAPAASLDVSIECSGSPRALQAAIDATRDGGTVVVASWYGRKPVALQLGTRFHRSHMRLIASQVSTMPGGVAATWSKARRFEAAWDLIRHVRPAATLLTAAVPLARAAEAYAALDRGEALVYHLTYAPGHEGSHAKL